MLHGHCDRLQNFLKLFVINCGQFEYFLEHFQAKIADNFGKWKLILHWPGYTNQVSPAMAPTGRPTTPPRL